MEQKIIDSALGYKIKIGLDLTGDIKQLINGENRFLVVDQKVFKYYDDVFNFSGLGDRVYILKKGEKSKTLKTIERINRAMLKAGCDRHTTLIAIGGGVTGDTAGFAAAVYMRGVKIVQVPTTLLSFADSSVGGKTGVNLLKCKNICGAFYRPEQIIMSMSFLPTLEYREIQCGLGEIIKTALLDKEIYDFVHNNIIGLISGDTKTLYQAVIMCVQFKDKITGADEKESGLRKILNLGHTAGHALETLGRYRLTHGQYVLQGIAVESRLAYEKGWLDKSYYDSICKLLDMVNAPPVKTKNAEKLVRIMQSDKKNNNELISFVFPEDEPGKVKERLLNAQDVLISLRRIL